MHEDPRGIIAFKGMERAPTIPDGQQIALKCSSTFSSTTCLGCANRIHAGPTNGPSLGWGLTLVCNAKAVVGGSC